MDPWLVAQAITRDTSDFWLLTSDSIHLSLYVDSITVPLFAAAETRGLVYLYVAMASSTDRA